MTKKQRLAEAKQNYLYALKALDEKALSNPKTRGYYPLSFTTWDKRYNRIKNHCVADAKCNFDENGNCERSRHSNTKEDYSSSIFKTGVGCCGGCFNSIGYFSVIDKEKAEYIKSLFLPIVGFWRPRTGCSLPRELRSDTCLLFCCGINKNKKYCEETRKQLFPNYKEE